MDEKQLKKLNYLKTQVGKLLEEQGNKTQNVMKCRNLSTRIVNALIENWTASPKLAVSTIAYLNQKGVNFDPIKNSDGWQEFLITFKKAIPICDPEYAKDILEK